MDYEMLWNAIPQPAIVLDAQDCILDLNASAQSFLSMSVGQARGRPIARHAGETSLLVELVEQVRRGNASLAQYNIDLHWTEQPPRLCDLHASPLHDDSDTILLVIYPRAIAEKMGRTLSHRSAARSVVGMASMLAHEIKNPLAGISGAAQLLAMSLSDQDRELTDLIREEAERIGKLLERVEQFGDIRPASRKPVNVHDILNRAKLSAQSGFAKHVRFMEEFDPSLPPTAGDADQLMQVLLNLIKNAAEATPKVGGIVTLRTSYRPGVKLAMPGGKRESLPLQITISDNGHGVPEEIKRDIFEPFVSSKATGSGLGLALVSKIIADHGGVIECESDPGWTTFRLLLPVWSEKAEAQPESMKGAA
ncbi:PAS domain-containing protein [Paroceanicella profunda]|uniref:histidine kinase n=1 Tax=Paroceanicella profunda TaxID=2579971 RepID=A0A5B8G2P2_9RHOB|nr:ATP-binding protein [Paroceanicella profunda]QDL92893.1 PAS domain-containing protein [Paroceanicella profunda]